MPNRDYRLYTNNDLQSLGFYSLINDACIQKGRCPRKPSDKIWTGRISAHGRASHVISWRLRISLEGLPFGNRLHSYGQSPFLWENSLFQWPCSRAMWNYQWVPGGLALIFENQWLFDDRCVQIKRTFAVAAPAVLVCFRGSLLVDLTDLKTG